MSGDDYALLYVTPRSSTFKRSSMIQACIVCSWMNFRNYYYPPRGCETTKSVDIPMNASESYYLEAFVYSYDSAIHLTVSVETPHPDGDEGVPWTNSLDEIQKIDIIPN